ncbi:DNA/RNA non-specific endonuclease [Motilimonas sp. E26]|uniref:DNA/RNA non-specific endonuclease n=1 Tax=Motilimonas sp. E26 TaxID=2865674 RepID=UPI001E4D39C1|nr:DNA/RNA non-specific endonuclease [Motilimonas sp. E26]MCE0557072.1 DNA/RNA non-specific endonuclease [Motilimonas sp. E26]
MRKLLVIACSLALLACQSSNNAIEMQQATDNDLSSPLTCSKIDIPSQSDQTICRDGYIVGFNYLNRVADWVSYTLTPERISGFVSIESFSSDASLPVSAQVTPADYIGSGYDRGHLAPAASMDFTVASAKQSYLMSNIAPQLAEFNRQGWAELEAWERQCTQQVGALKVVTGPLYSKQDNQWMNNKVRIPSAYFKAYLAPQAANTNMAFIIPHQRFDLSEINQFQVTMYQLEQLSNLSLFQPFNTNKNTLLSLCQLTNKTAPDHQAFSCQDKYYCNEMTSCQEAQFYLNSCGIDRLDNDNDGLACESLCF